MDISEDPFDPDALETGESSGLEEHVEQIKQRHTNKDTPIVETVEEDEDDEVEQDSGAHTPLDDIPLSQASEAIPDNDKEDIADHLHPKQQAGEPNPTGTPLDLEGTPMHTENPTAKVGSIPIQDMPGRTFLMPPEKDGSRYRAKIIELVDGYLADAETDPERIKFKCIVNDKYE